jgi:hypothetical protein
LAAYYAALKAADAFTVSAEALILSQKSYDLETRAILGQSPCDHETDKKPRVTLYLDHEAKSISFARHRDLSDDDYVPVHYDFVSLGRAALEQVRVPLEVYPPSPLPSYEDVIFIGNIIRDKDAHVTVYIPKGVSFADIRWSNRAIDVNGDLFYHPLPRIRINVSVDKTGNEPTYFPVFVSKADTPVKKVEGGSDKNA